MTNEECFSTNRCPVYSRAKAFHQLSFLHHSKCDVRYSAVLFGTYRLWLSNDAFRAADC